MCCRREILKDNQLYFFGYTLRIHSTMFSSENPQYLRQGLSMFGQSTYLNVSKRIVCPCCQIFIHTVFHYRRGSAM